MHINIVVLICELRFFNSSLWCQVLSISECRSLLEPQDCIRSRFFEKKRREDLFKRLRQIKHHSSKFKLIDRAIEMIPKAAFEPKSVLRIFNETIAGYSMTIKPFPIISHIQELQELERQIEDYALQKLWDALWNKPLASLAKEHIKLKTIKEIREWFEDEQNQVILDKVFVLDLHCCYIIQLPREIFQLRNLRKLDLYGNCIEVLPESIKVWKKLKKLDLGYNELTYLPHNGIKYLKTLQYFHVGGNLLNHLPRSIRSLKRLRWLNIKENNLTQLPKEIGQCIALKVLNVSKNRLLELHPDVKNLTGTKIYVTVNKVKKSGSEC